MNFSKRGTIRKQRNIRTISKKLAMKSGITFFRVLLVTIVAFCIIGVCAGVGAVKGMIDDTPSVDPLRVAPTGFSSTMYDSDGNVIQKLAGAGANRIYRTLDKIPKWVQNAFIAIEDERFYEHNGIDVRGIFRAFFVGLSNGGHFTEGASTITQQLLKNQIFSGGNEGNFILKLERKFQEQYLAIQLENELTKDQILEYYLNTINLGQNSLGVQTASLRYFNKDVSELTISEASAIAAITKNPEGNNPITNPEANNKRRKQVLYDMLEQSYITQEEYDEALADDVYSRIQAVNTEFVENNNSVYSYFVDETIKQVAEDLVKKKGYTSTRAYNLINSGGLSIFTTQDAHLQNICDSVLSNEENFPSQSSWELTYALSLLKADGSTVNYSQYHLKKEFGWNNFLFKNQEDVDPYIKKFKKKMVKKGDKITGERKTFTIQPQISFVLMDHTTGQVKAIVGGRGEKIGNLTLNRATSTVRQPGSTFKVLSTFLPALDSSGFTLASVQDDSPYTYPGTNDSVSNWWNGSYKGLSTLRKGIWYSMNIVTLRTLEQIGLQTSFDYLQKLGFTTLVESRTESDGRVVSDIQLPLALGGLTDGVTNLELTAGFASIANKGVYIEPIFYTKVVDHDGNVILDNTPVSRQVMKESTAFLLTDAMADTLSIGTGKDARLQKTNMAQAAKTGTTTKNNDIWLTGFTPYYTATIWSGYDNNGNQSGFTSYHRKLWKLIMDAVHKELAPIAFSIPNSITTATVCSKCGKLAVNGLCNEALGGSTTIREYFAEGTVPTEKCDCHVKLKICTQSNELATEYCPEDSVKEVVYLIKDEVRISGGKTVSYTTDDTPNVLPKKLENTKCHLHKDYTGSFVFPGITDPEKPDGNTGFEPETSNPSTPEPDPDKQEPENPDETEEPSDSEEESSQSNPIENLFDSEAVEGLFP